MGVGRQWRSETNAWSGCHFSTWDTEMTRVKDQTLCLTQDRCSINANPRPFLLLVFLLQPSLIHIAPCFGSPISMPLFWVLPSPLKSVYLSFFKPSSNFPPPGRFPRLSLLRWLLPLSETLYQYRQHPLVWHLSCTALEYCFSCVPVLST